MKQRVTENSKKSQRAESSFIPKGEKWIYFCLGFNENRPKASNPCMPNRLAIRWLVRNCMGGMRLIIYVFVKGWKNEDGRSGHE